MRDLRQYRKRRDPERTPEPFGLDSEDAASPAARARPAGAPRIFAVQQHAASRLHFDLRLEIGEVLVSWAVPKGPSLDPAEKRFAAQTEDHPLAYADFEGVIPEGNYGAGAMILWDRGTYECVDGRTPAEGLEHGKLDLLLEGHKLRGRFALVRMKGEDGKSWLLLRKGNPPNDTAEIIDSQPGSVLSGLTVQELRDGVTRQRDVRKRLSRTKAPKSDIDPAELRPMLASRAEQPFSRDGWLFELKYDGVRILAAKTGSAPGDVHLYTRRGVDRTSTYPEIARAISFLPVDRFVLDGEITALDASGRSSFERLQRRFTPTDPEAIARAQADIPVVCFAFDLLFADGRDLRGLPLTLRKEVLSLFTPRTGFVRFVDHVEGDGRALFEAARDNDLEGVVAKKGRSRYETGVRSTSWKKIKVPRSAALVVVGVVGGRGSRKELGSLALAWHRDGELTYAGNAGSGLDERSIADLREQMAPLVIDAPACRNAPEPPSRGIRWLAPRLVCEVRYTEVTGAGHLRHPVFVRLLPEWTPDDCVAPGSIQDAEAALPDTAPASAESDAPVAASLELTRLDKVFWPVEGYTKGDLLRYYEQIWPWLEPYLRDRPVVLTRYPDGIEGKSFYQKNAPDFTPDWARRENIDGTDYFVCNDLRTLLYVINSGAIPLHVGSARLASLDRPDWLILDLDPKEAPFAHVVAVARHIHALLDELGVPHYAKTSGQDGLHVLLPLAAELDHRDAKILAEVLARVVVADLPDIATIVRPVAARGNKVYVDFLQNGRGKLIASPFSVRPRAHAPVSMPLTWRQVGARLDPSRFNLKTAPGRMKKTGDPMRELLDEALDVEALLAALTARLD